MKRFFKTPFALFLIIISFYSISTIFSAETRLFSSDSVLQGDPLTVIIYPVPAGELSVKLRNDSGRAVSSAEAFKITVNRDITVYVAILGISSTLKPGDYSVEVGDGSEALVHRSVKVLEKSFFEEKVPLNTAMTTLRSEPDPKKDEQTETLTELLWSFDPQAVYNWSGFIRPVRDCPISSGYGSKRIYLYSNGGTSTTVHNGIDYAVPVGTPVHAAGSGKIVFAEFRILTGNSVVIEYMPGVYGIYYHMDSLAVHAGEFVRQNEILGKSGRTGLVTGPHLHYEVRIGGIPADPDSLMRKALIDKSDVISIINTEILKTEGR